MKRPAVTGAGLRQVFARAGRPERRTAAEDATWRTRPAVAPDARVLAAGRHTAMPSAGTVGPATRRSCPGVPCTGAGVRRVFASAVAACPPCGRAHLGGYATAWRATHTRPTERQGRGPMRRAPGRRARHGTVSACGRPTARRGHVQSAPSNGRLRPATYCRSRLSWALVRALWADGFRRVGASSPSRRGVPPPRARRQPRPRRVGTSARANSPDGAGRTAGGWRRPPAQFSIARAARALWRIASAVDGSTAATTSAYSSISAAPVRKSPRRTSSWARS